MTETEKSNLPDDTKARGVYSAAAVLLESGDGKILLSRRGEHLRTFPGIWVPPGTCVLVLCELEATKNTDFILLI